MMSSRSHRSSVSALYSSRLRSSSMPSHMHASKALLSQATVAVNSAAGARTRSSSSATTSFLTPSSMSRHRSTWAHCRFGTRTKHFWHKPGCTWVNSEGDSKMACRDQGCAACQEEQEVPLKYSHRELIYQKRRQQLDMLRKHIEKDPYEALFGWSNRRLNALWSRNPFLAMKSDVYNLWLSRASLHSDATRQARSSSMGHNTPAETKESRNPSESSTKSTVNSDMRASISWRTTGTDSSGRTYEKSGDLVYDPISNRMVPRHQRSDEASPAAIGQGIHATSTDGQATYAVKHARPSTDRSVEALPSDSSTPYLALKAEQTKRREIQLDEAKKHASSAVGVEDDVKHAGWAKRTADNSPPSNKSSVNAVKAPMQKLVHDGAHLREKYVTPSQDPADVPNESSSLGVQDAMRKVKEREVQLQQAKDGASSAVGVEEDAQRAGWTNKKLNPEQFVRVTDIHQQSKRAIRLEPSLDRHIAKAPNTTTKDALGQTPLEESLNEDEEATMKRIQARERELEDMRQRLDFFKAKAKMEQSWKRELSNQTNIEGLHAQSNKARDRAGINDYTAQAESWTQFKRGFRPVQTGSVAKVTSEPGKSVMTGSAVNKRRPERPMAIGDERIHDPKLHHIDSQTGAANSETSSGTRPSNVHIGTCSDSRAQDARPAERIGSLHTPKEEKPLETMSLRDLARHRNHLLDRLGQQTGHYKSKQISAATRKLQEEVSAQKLAMNAFENRGRLSPQSTARETTSSLFSNVSGPHHARSKVIPVSSEPVEMTAGEGDMSPRVAEFAQNGKWYKDTAYHAKLAGVGKETSDRELVQDIRTAYESAYGTIDETHQQGPLLGETTNSQSWPESRGRNTGYVANASCSSSQQTSKRPSMNPIDGTTQPSLDTVSDASEPASFAGPTSYAPAHDGQDEETLVTRKSANKLDESKATRPLVDGHKRSRTTPRLVRREEPVFSGQLPSPKYTVPEAIEILRKQGLIETPQDRSLPSPSARKSQSGRHDRRRRTQEWRQGFRFALLGGGFGAACCYAIGILVEYGREPRIQGGYDQGRPTWDGQRSWHGEQVSKQSGKPATPESAVISPVREGQSIHVSDMPLHGFEYPMMGMLVACIWYILSFGGS